LFIESPRPVSRSDIGSIAPFVSIGLLPLLSANEMGDREYPRLNGGVEDTETIGLRGECAPGHGEGVSIEVVVMTVEPDD